MSDPDLYKTFRFRLEIGDAAAALFHQVHIGAASIDVIDYREGADPNVVRKLSGLVKYTNITLRRGYTDSRDFFNWFHDVATGGSEAPTVRRDIVIIVQRDDGTERARFLVSRAWPCGYHPGDLDSLRSGVLIESIELAHEGFRLV